MSNPDFPGPYGQDRPKHGGRRRSRGPSARYRDVRGRHHDPEDEARWAASVDRPSGYSGDDADHGYGGQHSAYDQGGSGTPGDARSYGDYQGYDQRARGTGYGDQAYGEPYRAEPDAGNGYAGDAYGRYGRDDHGGDPYGRDGYGYDADGRSAARSPSGNYADEYPVGGYDNGGYGQSGYERNGYPPNGYGPDGYGDDGYGEDGYGRGGYDPNGYRYGPGEYEAGPYDDELAGAGRRFGLGRLGGRRRLADSADDEYGRAGGPGQPPRNFLQRLWYGRWWRHWTWKKVGLLTGATALFMVALLIAGFLVAYNHYQVPTTAQALALDQSSTVYYSNGQVVGSFTGPSGINRTIVPLSKMGKYTVPAILALEDRNFYNEGGISITGTLRALMVDLTGGQQGGSTITQQLVKQYYESPGAPRDLSTKLREIIVAIKLARQHPGRAGKDWILTQYLNIVYMGPFYSSPGAYGVQAAAETYFGIPAYKLTLSQSAMLAAMPNSPGTFDPRPGTAGHALLVDRWKVALINMVRDGAITQAQANAAKFPAVVPIRTNVGWSGYQAYIMSMVKNEIDAYYPQYAGSLYTGGLRIYTSISKARMNGLYRAVQQNKLAMETAPGGLRMPSWVRLAAVVERPATGQIVAFYGGPGYGTKHCQAWSCDLNTILQAEPVGSSFKPLVLTTAVSQGMNVKTSVLNSHSPLCIPPDWNSTTQMMLSKQTTKCSIPNGYWLFSEGGENTRGNDSVPVATAQSNDPAFEDLIHRTTDNAVIKMAGQLGVSPGDVAGLNALFGNHGSQPGSQTAALGQGSLSAVDQANIFSTLVSGGKAHVPHIIDKIVSGSTTTLASSVLKSPAGVPAGVAADADYALSFDTTMAGGTGGNAALSPARPMIGKTGTLGQGTHASQAWFIGATPQYAMSVALFADHPQKQQYLDVLPTVGSWSGGYGGAWPATIWHTYWTEQFNSLPALPLPNPPFAGKKWMQVAPAKKKKHCQNAKHGQGHGRHGQQCQNGPGGPNPSNSPSYSPSNSPSNSPSGSPTYTHSPSPSNTPSHTPSPTSSRTKPLGAAPAASTAAAVTTTVANAHRPAPKPHSAAAAGLTAVVTPPREPLRPPARQVTTAL